MPRRRLIRAARSSIWNVYSIPSAPGVQWIPPTVATRRRGIPRKSSSSTLPGPTTLVLQPVSYVLTSKRRFVRHVGGGGIFAPPVRLAATFSGPPTFTTSTARRGIRPTKRFFSFVPKSIPVPPPSPWRPDLTSGRHAQSLRSRRGSFFVPSLGPIVPPPPPSPWRPGLLFSRRPLRARSHSSLVVPIFPLPAKPILPSYSPILLRTGPSARSTRHQHLSTFVAPLTFVVPPTPPPVPAVPETPEEEYGSMTWARRQWRKRHRPKKGLDRSSVWRTR